MQQPTPLQASGGGRQERLPQRLGLTRALFAAALVLFFAACNGSSDSGLRDTASGTAQVAAEGVAGGSSPESDAAILASINAANLSDSATGAIAARKAASSDLRAFAALMVREHHAMRLEGERVARRLRLTLDTNTDTSGGSDAAATLSLLNSTPRGRDFDKAYIDHEVAFHLDFLERVTGAMERASETEVKAFIQKLSPMLLEHFDRARELQARLR